MIRVILTASAAAFLWACGDSATFQTTAKSDGLVANAVIDIAPSDFQSGTIRYSGTVSIQNTSNQAQSYSNTWLWLNRENGPEARAWLGNLTSHYIDEATVELVPGEDLELPVYWVFDKVDGATLFDGTVALELRPNE